jgi:hypothetical protein
MATDHSTIMFSTEDDNSDEQSNEVAAKSDDKLEESNRIPKDIIPITPPSPPCK